MAGHASGIKHRLDTGYLQVFVARYGNQSNTARYEALPRYNQMAADYSVWDWNLGGLTPIGLPDGGRLLVDPLVLDVEVAVIGSGVRRSKLLIPGSLAAELPRAEVIQYLAG